MDVLALNNCYLCLDPSAMAVASSISAHDLQIKDFLQRTGIKLPQEESHLELMLCFNCIDGFLDIQAAFTDCVGSSIAEQLLKSTQGSGLNATKKTKRAKKPIEMPNEIISDLDLNQLGDFEEYLMMDPSLDLLEASQITLDDGVDSVPTTPQSGKALNCEHCLKKFAKSNLLKKHIELKHQKSHAKRLSRYKALSKTANNKAISKKQESKPKKAVHEDKPLASCEVCPKAFQSERSLAIHKRTHQIRVVIGKMI